MYVNKTKPPIIDTTITTNTPTKANKYHNVSTKHVMRNFFIVQNAI